MPKSRRNFGSNFKVLDAHVIQPEEYEEAPEWTDAQISFSQCLQLRSTLDGDGIVGVETDACTEHGHELVDPLAEDEAPAQTAL
jgi:hypothetical protein